jgi:CRP-like cAMP-binding protein
LEAEFKRGGEVQAILLAYVASVLAQSTQFALCSHVHTQQERLACWLLMTADRAGGPRATRGSLEFNLPPEFLAQMLATDTSMAMATVGTMQRAGLLTYSGNRFRLAGRRDMEDASCDCYSHIRHTFKSLVG